MNLGAHLLAVAAHDMADVGQRWPAAQAAVSVGRLALPRAGVHPCVSAQIDHFPVKTRTAPPPAGSGGVLAKLPADDLPGVPDLVVLGVRPGDLAQGAERSRTLVAVETIDCARPTLGVVAGKYVKNA